MHHDVYKANMVQKKNIYTTFCLWASKTKELFFVLSQPLISPQAIHPFQGTLI